jgi:hypothetical protein
MLCVESARSLSMREITKTVGDICGRHMHAHTRAGTTCSINMLSFPINQFIPHAQSYSKVSKHPRDGCRLGNISTYSRGSECNLSESIQELHGTNTNMPLRLHG